MLETLRCPTIMYTVSDKKTPPPTHSIITHQHPNRGHGGGPHVKISGSGSTMQTHVSTGLTGVCGAIQVPLYLLTHHLRERRRHNYVGFAGSHGWCLHATKVPEVGQRRRDGCHRWTNGNAHFGSTEVFLSSLMSAHKHTVQ